MLDDVIQRGVSWHESIAPNSVVCYFEGSRIFCQDGFSFAAAAGAQFSSTPKSDKGPYLQLEIGFPSGRPEPWETWQNFSTDNDEPPTKRIYGYVPVWMVRRLVADHGGEIEQPEIDPVEVENLPAMHTVKAVELQPILIAMQHRDQENPAAMVLSSRFVIYSPTSPEEYLIANCGDEGTAILLSKAMIARTDKSVVIRCPGQYDKITDVVTTMTTTLLSQEDWDKARTDDINEEEWPWSEGLS